MKRTKLIIVFLLFVLGVVVVILQLRRDKNEIIYATNGQVVDLDFDLDKKIEFGEYYFAIDNGKSSTYPLCFCLTEKNTYPPDCFGDVKYLFKNTPGTMCIPMKIGNGRCSMAPIETLGYATSFIIPLEYSWTKPFEKILTGIRVPKGAPAGARLVVAITILKPNKEGKKEPYRHYEKTIVVKNI